MAVMNGQITIDVGLKMQILQSTINDIQKTLDKLKPDSSGFKELQTILSNTRREMDRLQIQSSKPFGSQQQFNQAGKTIEKIEESLGRAQIAISRLKFSDLKLDAGQQAEFDQLAKKIQNIQKTFLDFKNTTKEGLLSNVDFNEFVRQINPNLINKSFDEIARAVENKTDDINNKLNKSREALEKYTATIQIGTNVEDFLNGGGISKNNKLLDFDKFFTQTKQGLKFKAGQKDPFFEWCRTTFSLNEAQIRQLQKENTAPAIQKILTEVTPKGENAFFTEQLAKAASAAKKQITEQTNFNYYGTEAERVAPMMELLANALRAVGVEEERLAPLTESARKALQEFQETEANTARTTSDLKFDDATRQLNIFQEQLGQANNRFLVLQRQQATFNSLKSTIVNFMGFNQVLNITKRAVSEAANHIQQLDTVMNGIAIVTDMTTADLWKQVDVYSQMAQKYGATIQGAYDVSKIYYQQGLETNDVLTLTDETLKLSKISGLDYATTTDYMTTAIRGFKMEMQDAAVITDVYSALASTTAVSQQELAEAMTRTASSMESVGSTFQDTSAMIATMVAVTRESANNIGSAMKSIASRYGELTKDPAKLMDSEGEAMSFNKVDEALKSVGISMQTVDHQFRDFTSVIVELADKWDTLDSTQQRYIATQFAGNRQQSRFLALVSNADLLRENMEVAANSEDTGTIQALKSLDSLESKLNQVQVAYQQFYTTIGIEGVWKAFLDGTKNVIDTLNNLPKLFGKIPVGAVTVIYDIISLIKTVALNGLAEIATIWKNNLNKIEQTDINTSPIGDKMITGVLNGIKSRAGEIKAAFDNEIQVQPAQGEIKKQELTQQFENIQKKYENPFYQSSHIEEYKTELMSLVQTLGITGKNLDELKNKINSGNFGQVTNVIQTHINSLNTEATTIENLSNKWENLRQKVNNYIKNSKHLASDMNGIASALNMIGVLFNTTSRNGQIAAGSLMSLSGAFRLGSVAVQAFQGTLNGIPWLAIATGIISIINGISTASESSAERLERLTKEAEELSNESKKAKAEYNTLQRSVNKLDELKEKRYESTEAAEEYQDAVNELANAFPQLIMGLNESGEVILNTANVEDVLTDARKKSQKATLDAVNAEIAKTKAEKEEASKTVASQNASVMGTISLSASELEQTLFRQDRKEDLYNLVKKVANPVASYESSEKQLLMQLAKWGNGYEALQQYVEENEFGGYSDFDLQKFISELPSLTLPEDLTSIYSQINNNDDVIKLIENVQTAAKELLNLTTDELLEDKNRKKIIQLEEDLTSLKPFIENSNFAGSFDLEGLGDVISQLNTIQGLDLSLEGFDKLLISEWQKAHENNGKAWEYLEESANAAALVTEQIENTIENSDWTTAQEDVELQKQWKEYQQVMEDFYSHLTPENQELFDRMLSNNDYSDQDIIKTFNIDINSEIARFIIEHYANSIENINKRLQDNLQNLLDNNKINESDFTNAFKDIQASTTNEEKYLNSILNTYEKLSQTRSSQVAEDFGSDALTLYDYLQKIPADIRNILLNSIRDNGLTTFEGIKKVLSTAENNEIPQDVIDLLSGFNKYIIENISLSIQSLSSNFIADWDDSSKDLEKALSSGVSIKEAEALINKAQNLGIENFGINSFIENGEKLILNEKAWNDYWTILSSSTEEDVTRLENNIKQIATIAATNRSIGDFLTKDELAILNTNNIDISGVVSDQGKITSEEGYQQIINNAVNSLNTQLDQFVQIRERAIDLLLKTTNWDKGDYSSLGNKTLDELKQIASGEIELGKEDYDARAVKEKINSVYNTLISDVLSKGFDKINIADYAGLINLDKDNLNKVIESEDYVNFVNAYVAYAGKTLEETNTLLVQAMQKNSESAIKTGEIESALKDLNFGSNIVYGSLDTLQKLSDAMGIHLSDLGANYNEILKSWVIDDSSKYWDVIQSDSEIIKDSIHTLFDNIAKSISNALSGKMSYEDADNLKNQLSTIGLGDVAADLNFSTTAEGLKLSEQSAIQLYQALQKVDGLRASLVFDDLRKSLEVPGSVFENISKTTGEVSRLEREIADAVKYIQEGQAHGAPKEWVDSENAKLAKLKDELSLARQIQLAQSQDPNQYKFMDRDLPDYLQGPENYWNAVGKAYKAMNESASSGYMAIDDFYNIVNEMNNIANITGTNLEFMGRTLGGNAADAAALIEEGLKALSNIDGEGVKIDFSKLSADMQAGAESMGDGFDDAIHSMADSQIKMLDGMITLLETIVAMEELGKIDIDKDSFLDLEEIFNIDKNGETLGFQQSYIDWIEKFIAGNEELEPLLSQVSINGHTLSTLLTSNFEQWQQLNISEEQFQNVLNALYKAAISGDYDLDNLMESIRNVLASTGETFEVDGGEGVRIAVGYGTTLTSNANGKYTVDGKEYNSIEAALQAKKLEDLGGTNIEKVEIEGEEIGATAKIPLGLRTVETTMTDGEISYRSEKLGKTYTSLKEMMHDEFVFMQQNGELGVGTSEKEYVQQEYGIEVAETIYAESVEITNKEAFQEATQTKINELASALVNGTDQQVIDAAREIGIEVDVKGELTAEQRSQIAELANITSETKALNLSISVTGDGKPIVDKLFAETLEPITVTVNVVKGEDETGLIADEESIQLSKTVSNITISKGESFTVTGEDALWSEVTTTKEFAAFIAYIKALQVKQSESSFTAENGDAIWEQVKTSKEYESFTAIIKSLIIQKVESGFTSDNGDAIWSEIVTSKEFGTFTAVVTNLITQKIGTGYTYDGSNDIWNDVVTTQEFSNFTAYVTKLLVSKASTGFSIDQDTIWNEINTTKEYAQFTAYVKKILAEKISSGFSTNDSSIWNEISTSKEYEQFTATVSAVVAEKAADGFTFNTLNILPEGDINLGSRAATVTVSEVKIEDGGYLALRNQLYQTLENASAEAVEKNVITLPSVDVFGSWNFNESGISLDENSDLQKYLNILKEMASSGQTLSTIDLTNLSNLKDILTATSSINDSEGISLEDSINSILQLNSINVADQTEKLTSFSGALAEIDATNLQACADAIDSLAKNIDIITAVDWSLLANNINSVNTPSFGLTTIQNNISNINNKNFDNFSALSSTLSTIEEQVKSIWDYVQKFANQTFTVTLNTNNSGDNSDSGSNITNDVTTNYSANIDVDTTSAVFATNALNEACKVLSSNASILAAKFGVMAIPMVSISKTNAGNKISAVSSAMLEIARSNAAGKVSSLASAMSNIPNVSYAVQRMANALSNIPSSKSMSVRFNYTVSRSNAKGNIANAKGTKDAKAKGTRRTLMGELGPELVVSNGRYYVVGQNGAEFVDLAADAIVFNHKQTKRLLSQGMIGSRGRPVTNETNAISFAKGTNPFTGLALAGAGKKGYDVLGLNEQDPDGMRERIVTKTTTEKIGSVSTTPRYYDMKLFSYAKGNMSGDAMASASQALAALKQIRAMWQSMLKASAKDLGALAGRGGKGGGGGGGGGSGAENEPNYYIHDLEIWYNLLRQIDKLEKDITYQESLQQKIESDRVANGKALYTSQKKELDYLSAEIAKQKQLSILQEKYYLKQVEEINNSPFSKIFTFNEEGLMQYNDNLDDFINEQTKNNSYYFKDGKLHIQGTSYVRDEEGNIVTDEAGNKQTANFDKLLDIPTSGLEFLALLNSTDEYGRPVYTAEELAEVLKAFNFGEYLQFDSSGKRIDESDENAAVTILQTFYDQIDSIREDTDSLHDGVEESREKLLELESKRNDILQKIIDNQLAVEQKVVNAIESREQAIIDNAQKERDALDEANKKFLDGLNEQLNRERQMYQNQQDESELIKMQRQLAILQRSGGSASQIRSLQDQINSKQKDMYFEAQQQQIDAIQEASDKEIERLDAQIDLMTETLEYQKVHGLLWEEVYQIMAQSPEQIRQFIVEYTPDFESNSALQVAEDIRDLDLKIQEWVAYREDAKKGTDPITADETHDWDTTKEAMGPMTAEEEVAAKAEFDKEMAETSDPNVAQSKAINKVEEIREESKPQEQQNQEENKVQEPAKTEEVAPAYQNISGQIFGQYYAHNAPNLDRSSRFKRNSSDPDDYIFGDSDRITSVNILGYKDDMYYISQNGVEGWISSKAFADSYVSSTRKALEAAKLAGTLRKYDKGGSIDFTGLAWVDGSTTEPETILSASNTEYLKNDILGGIKGLNNIVMNFRNAIQDLVSSNNNPFNAEQNEGINIEKVELTMQVNSIANDYDARQAGSQALNEIVKIARKSGTRGLSRR